MYKLIIYKTNNYYFVKPNAANIIIETAGNKIFLDKDILGTFVEEPLKVYFVTYENEMYFILDEEAYSKEAFFKICSDKDYKNQICSDLNNWSGTDESFIEQFRFHSNVKKRYKSKEKLIEIEYSIVNCETENPFIEPVINYSSTNENNYKIIFEKRKIIDLIAKKKGFKFVPNSYGTNINEKEQYSCNEQGDYLKFKFGYYNTVIDKLICKFTNYPGSLENCKEEYDRCYREIENVFDMAYAKLNPVSDGNFDFSTLHSDISTIKHRLIDIEVHKKYSKDRISLIALARNIESRVASHMKKE